MENNYIFIIIVVIVIIIIIVAISNRSEEITHHHTKPHFDQPKNVMRITASDHIRSWKVFKAVMNDHSEQIDQDVIETSYKGHEPDNSTTNLVQVGEIANTFPHGTDVEIPLIGEGIDHDAGQLTVEGSTTDGRIDTVATVSTNPNMNRIYTVTFPAGDYSNPGQMPVPIPFISNNDGTGPNTFHVTISPGSNISLPANQGDLSISVSTCGGPPGQKSVCVNSSNYLNYGQLAANPSFDNIVKYCLVNDSRVPCSSDSLSMNASFNLRFNPLQNSRILEEPTIFQIRIDSTPPLTCGNPCVFDN